jgi:FkbM family methyltransferase
VPIEPLNPRILDIGANLGSFAIWASYRWPGCHVYAYEPDEDNFKILNRNLDNNNITSVAAMNWAIGEPGERTFYPGRRNCGEGGFYADTSDIHTPVKVTVRDPLSLPHAHILKMDIEGCEIEVLKPLIEAGRVYDAVMFEYHNIEDRRVLDRLLEDYVLTGCQIYTPHRGVMRYVHKRTAGLMP